ncbi:M20 family metallo-hydrolase [Pseudarthrobacter sp. PS3-L1]|uniref:M20 family metallo-hydrolase n=1 Tax=Pseudarthrobacter sp. PS3-L1 TaxID=3046207 RepID=UPI0024BAAD00|nr:M20 family metallo-hydrolase [Pseudarthrobacter sp. PS3-L1]MDJ0319528.1 M20 family metallo-hydrolase [Pseudarthrobacter sp. PS3-L1]
MSTTDEQFLADFANMSSFGATAGGGVDRQAGTAADHATRSWFSQWLAQHGFTETVDGAGNQFGTLELVPGAAYVLVGSHLDSQPLAGRYDGAYGVLAAAHAGTRVASEFRSGKVDPAYNLAVVNWFNEEGSRFAPSMMGSGVFTGKLALRDALATADPAGTTVAEALAAGHRSPDAGAPVLAQVARYAEIHIEQGRELEESGTHVGIVDRTWAASKYRVSVDGAQSHTGATRMEDRRDALYGAALVIAAARELTAEFEPGLLHTSVSELFVLPNSPVTIARQVLMNLDLRSPDESVLILAMERLGKRILDAQADSCTDIHLTLTHNWGLLSYQPGGVALGRASADGLGFTSKQVMTVAGHDSTNLKDVVPTVMLFVPSVEGISHNEAEFTRDEDALRGVELLTDVTRRLVRGDVIEG